MSTKNRNNLKIKTNRSIEISSSDFIIDICVLVVHTVTKKKETKLEALNGL